MNITSAKLIIDLNPESFNGEIPVVVTRNDYERLLNAFQEREDLALDLDEAEARVEHLEMRLRRSSRKPKRPIKPGFSTIPRAY